MSAPLNLRAFEPYARERLLPMVYGYYAGGANDEHTLRANETAFDDLTLYPRMLRGASERSLETTLLGKKFQTPLFIAPMALQCMAHPDGELAMTRAASAHGVGMVLSTMSSVALEDVASVAGNAPLWFQLYVYKDREVVRDMVQRAEASGYSALVLTVDTPLLGRREKDIELSFHLPEGVKAANLKDEYFSDVNKADNDSALAKYWREVLREGGLTWRDVDWLKGITTMPILLKGILRADDARLALEHGAGGIIVSNHGGRQLDGAPASVRALPAIVQAVGNQLDVLMDGGVRRGTDVLKALALGAKGVLVGRPMLWALAYDGQAGVELALKLLLDEIDLAMALCGCKTLAEVDEGLLTAG